MMAAHAATVATTDWVMAATPMVKARQVAAASSAVPGSAPAILVGR